MKVLYLDHCEGDFLASILYKGLCLELGSENIIDFPWKHTYHGQNYEGPVPYPPPGDRGVASPYPWVPAQPGRAWDLDEVCSRIGEFDLCVLASPRAYNTEALVQIIARCGRAALRRLVLVDGEDYTSIRWDYVELFQPAVYFKLSMVTNPREAFQEAKARVANRVRVIAFPLASPVVGVPQAVKDIDVVFLGGGNWRPGHQEGAEFIEPPSKPALDARLAKEFQSFVGGTLAYENYISTLARARVAVCVGGWGIEPVRTYEILSCPETLLMRERLDAVTPYPLVEGETHAGFDGRDWDGLVAGIRRYLADEVERKRVASNGNAFLMAHYTPEARARQLLTEALR